ncbi:hypothetical protein GCM10010495_61170 [Kitasatospora herbaricolor]|nr:hypothetical protein GCM10010495_61170 [Kitasatospora herbaricolor]
MAQAAVLPSARPVPPVLPAPAVGVAGAVAPGLAGAVEVGTAGVVVAGCGVAVLLGRSEGLGSSVLGPHAVAASSAVQAAAPSV